MTDFPRVEASNFYFYIEEMQTEESAVARKKFYDSRYIFQGKLKK